MDRLGGWSVMSLGCALALKPGQWIGMGPYQLYQYSGCGNALPSILTYFCLPSATNTRCSVHVSLMRFVSKLEIRDKQAVWSHDGGRVIFYILVEFERDCFN